MTRDQRSVIAYILRVFADEHGQHGNPLGVVLDENNAMSDKERRHVARTLGFSETAFVTDVATRRVSFFSPSQEVDFAGHAAVGVAWFLAQAHRGVTAPLLARPGSLESWQADEATWVAAELRWTPGWWHERLEDPADVEALRGPLAPSQSRAVVWAWVDEPAALVRARTFATGFGIAEDEANGSGCMRLAAALGRRLSVLHGVGSTVLAEPRAPGVAAVGGRVVEDGTQLVRW
jgi:predicted PhzF superfamily epimerase YddE/YHI9